MPPNLFFYNLIFQSHSVFFYLELQYQNIKQRITNTSNVQNTWQTVARSHAIKINTLSLRMKIIMSFKTSIDSLNSTAIGVAHKTLHNYQLKHVSIFNTSSNNRKLITKLWYRCSRPTSKTKLSMEKM